MTLSRRSVRGAVWVVLLVAGSVLARAQEVSGTISGTVVDGKGAGVTGAVVTVTDSDKDHVERTLKTNKAGFYSAPSLAPGRYSVAIAASGFKTASINGIMLHANDVLKMDQTLQIGNASDTVSVDASPLPVNLGDSTSKSVITTNQVTDLVLPTRNYEQLVALQPGVSQGANTDQLYLGSSLPALGTTSPASNIVAFSVNGLPPTDNTWTVDGADNVNRGGANSPTGALGGQTLLTFPSVDAISEVVTLRGTYEAEYGRTAGGQINVSTLSGTSDYHGGAYEFFRNNDFDANTYFNNLSKLPTPVLRYNDFGFKVGGPVVIPHFYNGKGKTFFFYSQEFRRVVDYGTSLSQVPTANERMGIFNELPAGVTTAVPAAVCAPGGYSTLTGVCNTYTATPYTLGQLFTSHGSPTAQSAYFNEIFNTLPLPNASSLGPNALVSNVRNTFNDAQEFVRIDEALTSKINIFYHFLHDSLPSTEANGLFPTSGALPGVSNTSTTSPGTQHLVHMTIAARPTMLIDMGYAYSSGAIHSNPVGLAASSVDAANGANSIASTTVLPYNLNGLSPTGSTLGIIPNITFAGGALTGIQNAGIYNQLSVNHNGFGDLTKVFRQHTLKFGVSYNHYLISENATGNASPYPQGNFSFAPSAPNSYQLAAVGGGAVAATAADSEFANFLLGNANAGFSQAAQTLTPSINQNLIETYAQDDWKATSRLTLNLGVRYSFFGQPFDDNHLLSNFDPAAYVPSNAETIDSNGNLCTIAGQTTLVQTSGSGGISNTNTLHDCADQNGLDNSAGNYSGLDPYQPNIIASPLNGIIYGGIGYLQTANLPFTLPSIQDQGAPPSSANGSNPETPFAYAAYASPWGQEVGHAEKHDFAPRVGFAFDVFGNGKTALRGGYGMVYDASALGMYEQEAFNNPPFLYVSNFFSANLSTPTCPTPPNGPETLCTSSAGAVSNNLTPPALYATPVIYKTPYVQEFSLDVQQEVTPTFMVDLGYFGSHGDHLLGRVDINEAAPGAFAQTSTGLAGNNSINYTQQPGCTGFTSPACAAPLNQIRPYLGYTAINAVQTIFNSNYNGLQLKATKRFSGKSVIDANYTYSRALTNVPGDLNTGAQNTYNLNAGYGPSPFNHSSVLTVDGIWDLPWYRDQKDVTGMILGGWEVSGIYEFNTGAPLTATMPSQGTVQYGGATSAYNPALTNGGVVNDAAGLGIAPGGPSLAVLRPNVVLNPNNGYGMVNVKTRATWFNPTAFIAPTPASYQVGNEKTGMIEGPNYNRLDVGIFRTFKVYHQVNFQIRGEAYNALNHTNWGKVVTDVANPQFGQVISARDPRTLQIGGKINF